MNRCLFCHKPITPGKDFHPECSRNFFGTSTPPTLDYGIEEIAELAKKTVELSITVPGVQPKLSLGLIKNVINGKPEQRLTITGVLGGSFILKPPTTRFPQMPENEFLTMRLAQLWGIRVAPFSLIRLKTGELSYITRRMDRIEGEKLHQLDMFQITEAFDKYRSSMERVGKAVKEYSEETLFDLVRLFELTIFNFISGNNDMHLKNFSLLLKQSWFLSPAYDLLNVSLHIPEDREETALTINGKKSKLKKKDFETLGEKFGLNARQIENTFIMFSDNKDYMIDEINDSYLNDEFKKSYIKMVKSRLSVFK